MPMLCTFLPRAARFPLLLAALAVCVVISGCGQKGPVTAESSNLRPAGESNASGEKPADKGSTKPALPEVAGGDSKEPKTGEATDKPVPPKPSTQPPKLQLDLNVPQAGPKELAAFITKLDEQLKQLVMELQSGPPTEERANAALANMKKIMNTRIETADKLLAAEGATDEQREMAAMTKVSALGFLTQVGEQGVEKRLHDAAVELQKDKDPVVAEVGAMLLLDEEIDKVASGETEDPAAMIASVNTILAGEPARLNAEKLNTAQNAIKALLRTQQVEPALALLRTTGAAFVKTDDEELKEQGQSLIDQAQLLELDFLYRNVQDETPGASETLLAAAKKALETKQLDMPTMMFVVQFARLLRDDHPETAQKLNSLLGDHVDSVLAAGDANALSLEAVLNFASQAEFSGNFELAKRICAAAAGPVAKLPDSDEKKSLLESLSAAEKRVGLVGQPLNIEGVLLDGKPFDWSAYKGKVVLVDFWATWCGPCLREIPNIEKNYEKYKDQGFEVVGINLDDKREDVDAFFERSKLPWATVFSGDPDAQGFNMPLARQCGVNAIPFLVLIGEDGKVMAIHVRGEELSAKLATIFGKVPPAAETPATDVPAVEVPLDDAPTDEVPAVPDAPPADEAPVAPDAPAVPEAPAADEVPAAPAADEAPASDDVPAVESPEE